MFYIPSIIKPSHWKHTSNILVTINAWIIYFLGENNYPEENLISGIQRKTYYNRPIPTAVSKNQDWNLHNK